MRILIADDHPLLRDGLRRLLATVPGAQVVAEACDGVEALSLAKAHRPEVVILDLAMPRMGGIETLRLLREAVPSTRAVVLSMYGAESFMHEALRAGAAGYVLKGEDSSELIAALHEVAAGRRYLSSSISPGVMACFDERQGEEGVPTELDRLSERERQVFELVARGNTTPQIARMLFISPKTVEKHRASILRKLGIATQTDAVKYAIRAGVLSPDFWKEE